MPYIPQAGLPADTPPNVPLIGANNFVNPNLITSTTAAAGFPVSNIGNPSTYLKWKGTASSGDEYITFNLVYGAVVFPITYFGIAGHNLGSSGMNASLEGLDGANVLLHFNQSGSSPDVITDNNTIGSAHSWATVGNAFLDTAQKRFGRTSLRVDGAGDYVQATIGSDIVFDSLDFTIDCWVRANSFPAGDVYVFYATGSGSDMRLLINGTSKFIRFFLVLDSTVLSPPFIQTANNVITTGTWQHIAVARSGSLWYLFVDGVLQGSAVSAPSVSIPALTTFRVGSDGSGGDFNGWIDEFRILLNKARWTANFTAPQQPSGWSELVSTSSGDSSQVLLHFDGVDGSTTIVDSNTVGATHSWAAHNNAQLSIAKSKFGGSSLLMDGNGDYLSTAASSDFDLGASDFTIDLWFNCTAPSAVGLRYIGGQAAGGSGDVGNAWYIYRDNSIGDKIVAIVGQGTNVVAIVSSSAFTDVTNTGWHHLALVRTGNSLKLFIDGVQEGGTASISGAINGSTADLTLGSIIGDQGTFDWQGNIDEFRMTVGTARWTANFTPPTAAAINTTVLTNEDKPIFFRWAAVPISQIRVHLRLTAIPIISVVYAGVILAMERSVTIGSKHVPVTYGSKTNVVNGMSETGQFLGRIVLGGYKESKAEFEWITPSFFRSSTTQISIAQFLGYAKEYPFFWVWSPRDYPNEVGYVWLTNDPQPETDPATGRVGLTLEMRGIA